MNPDVIDVHVLVDLTGRIPPAMLQQAAADMTTWASEVLAPQPPHGWGRPVAVRAATPDRPPQPGEYVVQLLPGAAPAGELADHGVTTDDTEAEVSHVYVDACMGGAPFAPGPAWDNLTDAITHEIAEATVDPRLNLCAQAPAGALWAYEACDAVQGTGRMYGATLCANVCLPAWFSPPASGDGPFDAHGSCTVPFQVLPTGYGQQWTGTKWVMLNGDRVPAHKLADARARINRRGAR